MTRFQTPIMKKRTNIPQLIAVAWIAATFPLAAHDHFAAGIVDINRNGEPDAGEPLRMIGPDPGPRVFHLLARPAGQRCGGYYMLDDNARTLFPNDAFSLTALSDGQEESADQDHARTGAFIWAEITAVTGPAGARFGFWDVGRSISHDTPDVALTTNETTGNPAFRISGGNDGIEQDPQGHIHGRAWTADKPGDYFVSFRFVDRSTSGPGGGPWHAPSEIFVFHFKAGPDFQPVGTRTAGGGFQLSWASRMGIWEPFQTGVVFQILRGSGLPGDDWTVIGSVTGTTAATVSFTDPSPPPGKAFYRLGYAWAGAVLAAAE